MKIKKKLQMNRKNRIDEEIVSPNINYGSDFGYIVISTEGNIVSNNDIFLEIFGIDKVPATIFELMKALINIDFSKLYNESMLYQKAVEIKEVSFGDKFLRLFCTPIININKIVDYIIIVEDITELKFLEKNKDEFFAVASHELRTPLTAIRGNSDMILTTYKNEISNTDIKEMLTDINNASVRLISIVNSFLEVSRLEQGRIETKLESFDLSVIVVKVINDISHLIGNKKLSLTYNPPSLNLPNVFADKIQTEQVLINLISNAIKYTDQGSIIVTIESNKNFVTVKVIDTGKGIDTKNQSLLFKKFQQASGDVFVGDYATSSGLGLYISKLLVKNMGGDIGLEKSNSDLGSTFFFTLPVAM